MKMSLGEIPRPSRRVVALAGGLLLVLVSIGALVTWRSGPAESSSAAALSPAKLARLPARPEDIEAHGTLSRSVLGPDAARLRNAAVAFAPGPLAIARPFAFQGSEEDRSRALQCLSAAVLYEAGDDAIGEAAVAQVVLNRVRHAAFPGTVCGVVYQGAQRTTGCQFTFTCDGSLRRTMPDAAWQRAREVAGRALAGRVDEAVGLATHYHTDWVYPYWSPELNKLARVGTHLFFGWPGSWGGSRAFGRKYRGNELIASLPIPGASDAANTTAVDVGLPRLPGLPVPPARLPAGMAPVPLYGNRLRLADPDGRAFGLLTAASGDAAKLVNAALALCSRPGPCEVTAWSNEDDIPGEYPIPAGARATMVFEYVRGAAAGKGSLRFDCERYPNRNPKACL
jgi:spore germination cell wall hydrolase CwlJ-like protein